MTFGKDLLKKFNGNLMAQCEMLQAMAQPPCVDILMIDPAPQAPRSNFLLGKSNYLPHNFFSYDKALSFFRQGIPDKPPGGLINIGYNCYMNSVIQCLAFTPGFQQFCLSMPNAMYENNSGDAFFLDSFAHIFALLAQQKSVCPDWLISDSHLISGMYKLPVQQDAHEFLLKILDTFDKECRSSLMLNDNIFPDPSDFSYSSKAASSSPSLPSSPSDLICSPVDKPNFCVQNNITYTKNNSLSY